VNVTRVCASNCYLYVNVRNEIGAVNFYIYMNINVRGRHRNAYILVFPSNFYFYVIVRGRIAWYIRVLVDPSIQTLYKEVASKEVLEEKVKTNEQMD